MLRPPQRRRGFAFGAVLGLLFFGLRIFWRLVRTLHRGNLL